MCGIFGQFSRADQKFDSEKLNQLANLLHHRGPDSSGFHKDANVFLAHKRLSIIDLSPLGNQPMFSADGRYITIFNGEIYNYKELKKTLIESGYSFKSNSDTEVLLHGYDKWKEELPKKLVGMFAFAIYDKAEKEIFLARDRFGEKPLFYLENKTGIVFSSQMTPLALMPDYEIKINSESLGRYLSLNYVPGEATLLQGIKQLSPGSWLKVGSKGTQCKVYWQPVAEKAKFANFNDAAEHLKNLLDESVKLTLRSDVPVGLFLSGGIDSSLVAESAVRQGSLKKAFCVDIEEESFSEWDKAKRVSERLGLTLERVRLNSSILDKFEKIINHADDPIADSSCLPVWAVSEGAAKDFKVVITGDGGDELFAGYLTYKATEIHRKFISNLPKNVRKIISDLSHHIPVGEKKVSFSFKLWRFLRAAHLDSSSAHFSWNGTWLPQHAAELLAPEYRGTDALSNVVRETRLNLQSLNDYQILDMKTYLPGDILTKVDRMTMAHSLESRAPLLDYRIAEFALSLPEKFLLDKGVSKRPLRYLAEKTFGPEIGKAKKQGFSIPIHTWLRQSHKNLVLDLLSKNNVSSIPFLDADGIESVRDGFLNGKKPWGFEIWCLMVLTTWWQSLQNKKHQFSKSEIKIKSNFEGVPSYGN